MNIIRTEAAPVPGGRVFIPALPTRWDAVTGVRQGVYNLNDAAKFGELITLSIDNDQESSALAAIEEGLNTFTEKDFILAIGDVARIIAAILSVPAELDSARLLQWDKRAQKYFVTEVIF